MKLDELPFEAQKELIRRSGEGASLAQIQEFVQAEFNKYVSVPSISKWLKRRKSAMHKAVYGSEIYTEQTAKAYAGLLKKYCEAAELIYARLAMIAEEGKPTKEMKEMMESLTLCLNTLKEHLGEGKHKEFASAEKTLKEITSSIENSNALEVVELKDGR